MGHQGWGVDWRGPAADLIVTGLAALRGDDSGAGMSSTFQMSRVRCPDDAGKQNHIVVMAADCSVASHFSAGSGIFAGIRTPNAMASWILGQQDAVGRSEPDRDQMD